MNYYIENKNFRVQFENNQLTYIKDENLTSTLEFLQSYSDNLGIGGVNVEKIKDNKTKPTGIYLGLGPGSIYRI